MSQTGAMPPRVRMDDAFFAREVSAWVLPLTAALQEQRELCERMVTLSGLQRVKVSAADTDGLLRILGERQVVVDRLSRLNEDLASFRRSKDRLCARMNGAQRETVAGLMDGIAKAVESVRMQDEIDRVALEAQRTAVADELAALSKGRGAVAAYAVSGPTAARFQDRSG